MKSISALLFLRANEVVLKGVDQVTMEVVDFKEEEVINNGFVTNMLFIRPKSDHCLALSVPESLSQSVLVVRLD